MYGHHCLTPKNYSKKTFRATRIKDGPLLSGGFPGGSDGKESARMQETQVQSLGWEDPLEKGMATHSRFLAWRIPWTEEPGGLQSIGSQRVRHDWATNTHTHTSLSELYLACLVAGACTQHSGCVSWAKSPHPGLYTHSALLAEASKSVLVAAKWRSYHTMTFQAITSSHCFSKLH